MKRSTEQHRQLIETLAENAGFQSVGFSDTDLSQHEAFLERWLDAGFHGEMSYMERHGRKRSRPDQLVPGTISVISVRMDYWPATATDADDVLANNDLAYVSRYALGRDYHKLMRKRLQQLASALTDQVGEFGYRVFVDSAPVLEKALAQKAGLGWIGKHSNLIHQNAGSWFFIGEIYTDLPLTETNEKNADEKANGLELQQVQNKHNPPMDVQPLPIQQVAPNPSLHGTTPSVPNHCGSCTACITACPTDAIVGPHQVDARRCISYLTIELRSAIPVEFREAIGNRIYGCDDCQLVCPFNKFASGTCEADFEPRHQLDHSRLVDLFAWTEDEFLTKTEGSAIRRIGYACWLRNIAVALGNAPTSKDVTSALQSRRDDPSELVREHVDWALQRHGQ